MNADDYARLTSPEALDAAFAWVCASLDRERAERGLPPATPEHQASRARRFARDYPPILAAISSAPAMIQ